MRPSASQVLHYQWFRHQPGVREAARAAHYTMWGSTAGFPILSQEEELEAAVLGLGEQEAVLGLGEQEAGLGLGGQEAGLDESMASLLLWQGQEHGPWRIEQEKERQEQEEERQVPEANQQELEAKQQELEAKQQELEANQQELEAKQQELEAKQQALGTGGKDVEMEEPVTRQKSSIKQRLRPRRHSNSVMDSLQNRGKRKAVAEERKEVLQAMVGRKRNEVLQAIVGRKRRKSEAHPAHSGREGGRRGRRRSTGVR